MGVQEYHFLFERGSEAGQEWLMYDVGGTRTLRHAWVPFFDDVQAIIFLAPINCFDEKLAEDRRVNRLEDSFLIWRAICESELLKRTQLVLFLNKCDLLDRKLKAGVLVKDFVPSFGDRSNTLATVAKCRLESIFLSTFCIYVFQICALNFARWLNNIRVNLDPFTLI